MAFDIVAARQANVSDDEIITTLAEKHGYKLDAARKAGVPNGDILSALLSREGIGQKAPPSNSRTFERTILPGAIASEYDVNAGRIPQQTPVSPSGEQVIKTPGVLATDDIQGAVNVAQAPRIPRELPTNQFTDIVQAQMAAERWQSVPHRGMTTRELTRAAIPNQLTDTPEDVRQQKGPTGRALSALQESTRLVRNAAVLPPGPTYQDMAVDTLKKTGAAMAGMGEQVAYQGSNLASMALATPNVIGNTLGELVTALVEQRKPSISNISGNIQEAMGLSTYKPVTESGQRQVEAAGQVMSGIPRAVDALDDATGETFKRNYPNAYAAVQVVGEFAPWIIGGKLLHGGEGKPSPKKYAEQADYDAFMQTYSAATGIHDVHDEFTATANEYSEAVKQGDHAKAAALEPKLLDLHKKNQAYQETVKAFGEKFSTETPSKEQINKAIAEMRKKMASDEQEPVETTAKPYGGEIENKPAEQKAPAEAEKPAATEPEAPDQKITEVQAKLDAIKARRGRYTIEEEQSSDAQPGEMRPETDKPAESAAVGPGDEGVLPTETTLKPAVKLPDGTVKTGELEDRHDDLLKQEGVEPGTGNVERGFVDEYGQFLSRGEAMAHVEENAPAVHAELVKEGVSELHSENLEDAVNKAAEKQPWEMTADEWMKSEKEKLPRHEAEFQAETERTAARVESLKDTLKRRMSPPVRKRTKEEIDLLEGSLKVRGMMQPLTEKDADITPERHTRIIQAARDRGDLPAQEVQSVPGQQATGKGKKRGPKKTPTPNQDTGVSDANTDVGDVAQPEGAGLANNASGESVTIRKPGGGTTTMPFDDALKLVQEGVNSGKARPVPFQVHEAFGISLGDADRVIAGLNPAPAIHPKSMEKFNAAFEGKNVRDMQDMLHSANKGLRAEFEKRAGVKLPKTVSGTDAAVADYFKAPTEPVTVQEGDNWGPGKKIPGPQSIGKNAAGEDLYEDGKGVRYKLEGSVKVSETVAMRPTRGGVETVPTGRNNAPEEWDVAAEKPDEAAAVKPHVAISDWVKDQVTAEKPFTWQQLNEVATKAHGSTQAAGALSALEALTKSRPVVSVATPTSSGQTLDMLGLQQAYESITNSKTFKEARAGLETIGRQAFREGASKYQDFVKWMKTALKDLWDRFKGVMEQVWDRVRSTIGNETGAVGRDVQIRYNRALDKVDEAIKNKDAAGIDKLLADLEAIDQEIRGAEDETGHAPADPVSAHVEDPQRLTSIKNAVTESEEEGGPVERHPFTRPELAELGKNKVDNDPLYNVRQRATEIVNNPRGAVSIEDLSALLYDKTRLKNEHAAMKEMRDAAISSGDRGRIAETRTLLARIEDDFEMNRQATVTAGTWQFSAAGHLRQADMTEDYSAVWMNNQAEAIWGKQNYTDALKKQTEEMSEKIAKLEKAYQDAVERAQQAEQQKAVQRIKNDEDLAPTATKKAKRAASRAQNNQEFKALATRLRTVLSPYRLNMNFDPEAVAILADMARLRIANGITRAQAIVDDIYDELHDEYAIEKRDIQDALSGYGKTFQMSSDEIDVTMREVKRQLKLLSALEDARAGKFPEKSGLNRDQQTDEVHRLREQVRQAMKASGLDNKATLDPEHQWKTSLDAAKTRLKNDINDLNRQIKAKKRDPVKKTGVQYDAEALKLKERRDVLKAALDKIDAKPGISAQRRVEIALDSLNKSIEEYERRIKTHDLGAKPKIPAPETPALIRQRAVLEGLKKTYAQMKKDAAPPKVPKTEAEKEEIYNRAYRTRLEKQAADLQTRRVNGDFETSARKIHKIDSDTERAMAARDRARQEWDAAKRKWMEQNRSGLEKALDFGIKVERAAIFASWGVIYKIGAAATIWRPAFTTLEELAGTVHRGISQVGLLSPLKIILEGAPREGYGLNVKAETAGYSQFFKSEMYRNFWDRIKTGKDNIQLKYGDPKNQYRLQSWGKTKMEHTEYILDMPGRAHSALKSVAYIQEFYRSLEQRTAWAIRNGFNPADQKTALMIKTAAESDANRVQLMADNVVNNAWRASLGMLRKTGVGGEIAAALITAQEPVMKVPINYAGELMSYVPGLGAAKAFAILANAASRAGKREKAYEYLGKAFWEEAASKMDEKEKDYFARALKKHTTGLLVCATIGWMMYKEFGRFYKRGEHRKAKDLKPGEIRVGGVAIFDKLLHFQGIDIMQSFAMIHHMEELAKQKEAEKEAKGKEFEKTTETAKLGSGALAAAMGISERVPFISAPVRLYNAAQSYEGMSDYTLQLVQSILIPSALPQIAKKQDTYGDVVIPRKGIIQGAIPGLRKTLPVDMKKVQKMQLDQLAEIMEHAPSKITDQIRPVFRNKYRRAHGLSDDERERYRDILSGE